MENKKDREARQTASILASDFREGAALRSSHQHHESSSEEDSPPKPKAKRARRAGPSDADTLSNDLSALTGELARMNESSIAAQTAQFRLTNELQERDLMLAEQRHQQEVEGQKELVSLRKLELELQKTRMEAELAIRGDTDRRFERMESQFGSIHNSLSAMMKYLAPAADLEPEPVVPSLPAHS